MAESERQLGDVLSNIPTSMLKIIESLWTQFLFTYAKGDMQGFKYVGLGGLYIGSGIVRNSAAKLYVYFYNSTGTATLDGKEILPSFMDYNLNIDDSKVIAYGSSLTTAPESGKEGQVLNVFSPILGETKIKFYFPTGVGTGSINSMCVSLVPLENLKTLPAANAIFAGTVFEGNTYNPYSAGRYFIPKVMMGEVEGSFAIGQNNISGSAAVVHTISSGNFENIDIPLEKKPCWGLGRIIDGSYIYVSSAQKIAKFDLTTGVFTEGAYTTNVMLNSLIEIDGNLYNTGNPANVGSAMTLKKVDLTTLSATSETYAFTIPDFGISGKGRIFQFENGDYGVIYDRNGLIFRFTDLSNPPSSVVNVYFTGITDINCAVIPIEEDGKLYFYGATNSGIYPYLNILAKGTSSTYLHILSDAQVGSPIIAYNKYNTSFEKTAETQLTTTTTISIP